MATRTPDPTRLLSLDQFRGYTILGMFFVNFIGHFTVFKDTIFKHHHTYCSYADTIMPQFFFAVGFAYRLTLLRRLGQGGPLAAYARAVRRNLGLILLGVVVYHLDGGVASWAQLEALTWRDFLGTAFKRNVFQTLTQIGVTALWVLPVIAAGPLVRIAFACLSGGLHLMLSYGGPDWSNYEWVFAPPVCIDGGPLGFLTWTIPLVAGSLAFDLVGRSRPAPADQAAAAATLPPRSISGVVGRLFLWGFLLMALGYLMSCLTLPPQTQGGSWEKLTCQLVEPPLVHRPPTPPRNIWTMSQRAGSLSYLTFGAGFSFAMYSLFVLICDGGGRQWGLFRTLGTNALAAYLIHSAVDDALKPYAPKDAPLWFALASFGVFLGICWLFVRHLEKNGIHLRL